MLKLLKRLELGLLTVALDSPLHTVDVVLEPSDSIAWKNRKKREKVQSELEQRQVDGNVGGMTRRKIMTAFREKSIRLACMLEREGQISTASLRERGLEDYIGIFVKNYDKWFKRVEKGVYALSEKGREALENEDYAKAVAFYRNETV